MGSISIFVIAFAILIPIPSNSRPVASDTMFNLYSCFYGHGLVDGTCKQSFDKYACRCKLIKLYLASYHCHVKISFQIYSAL